MTLLCVYSSPPFLYPLCLEASFSLPPRIVFCPLVLKPGALSMSKCAGCPSCLWMQLHFESWNSEGLQPSTVALIAPSLSRNLEYWSVHVWLRCVGMGNKGVGRMQWLLTGCSYVGKRGKRALRQSLCLNTQYLPELLCCLGQSSLICFGTCWLCKKRLRITYLLLRVHLGSYTVPPNEMLTGISFSVCVVHIYQEWTNWCHAVPQASGDTNNYRWWMKCKHCKLSPSLFAAQKIQTSWPKWHCDDKSLKPKQDKRYA